MPIKPDPTLQPLRIPTGWELVWNVLLDAEPAFESGDHGSIGFGEDLLQLSHKRNSILLDLGWYSDGDPHGTFRLLAIRTYLDAEEMRTSWDKPLRVVESRSKAEIVQAVEDWLWYFAHHAE